jgi:hypothetical protein
MNTLTFSKEIEELLVKTAREVRDRCIQQFGYAPYVTCSIVNGSIMVYTLPNEEPTFSIDYYEPDPRRH